MASASIFLSLPAACSVQGPYLYMNGVCLSCLGGSTQTCLLNRVESRTFRLINSSNWLSWFFSHRSNVSSVSLFYSYFHADCSSELANYMPPSFSQPHCTRLSTSFHSYSVHFCNARVNQYLYFFIPYTGKLWKSLPLSVFLPDYNLKSFKRGVSRHL